MTSASSPPVPSGGSAAPRFATTPRFPPRTPWAVPRSSPLAVLANTLLLARVLDHAPARAFMLAGLLAIAAGLWVFWALLALSRRGGHARFVLCFLLCAALHMACLASAWLGANHPGTLIDPGARALPTAALLALLPAALIALTLRQAPPPGPRPHPPRPLPPRSPNHPHGVP